MPHHKQAAAPQTSILSIPSLLCFECSALASCTRAGKMLLKEHGLVTADKIITLFKFFKP